MPRKLLAVGLAMGMAVMCTQAAAAGSGQPWSIPVAVQKLDNGMTVVVSEDHSSPTVGISMVCHVGIRLEPWDRTGFAHLFDT